MNKAYYSKNSSDYWAVSTTRNENLTNNFLCSRAKDRKKKDKKKLDEHAELFCQSFLDFLVAVAVGKSQSCFAKAFLTFLVAVDRESKAPSLPLFLQLGWLPIRDRILFMHATIVFKALNCLSPSYITDLILPFSKVHNIDTHRARRKLKLPKANTNSGKRTFAFLASSEWNLLPDYVTTSTSLSSFKRKYFMGCPSSMSKKADSFYTDSYMMSIISHS